MERDAILSACGLYRYSLTRIWNPRLPIILFIGLNPSKADAQVDDPTVRKWMGFADRWKAGGFYAANLFAFRATNPADMRRAADPVGPDNDGHLINLHMEADMTVACWGGNGTWNGRDVDVLRMLAPLTGSGPIMCIRPTKHGHPCHPAREAYTDRPVPLDLSKFQIGTAR